MRRLLPLALLAAGCIDDLPPQYHVDDLRILAVRAEVLPAGGGAFADALPGDTLRLEALVANPRGRTLTATWYACAPTGGLPPCRDEQTLRDPGELPRLAADPAASGVLALGTGPFITFPVPEPTQDPNDPDPMEAAFTALARLVEEEPTYACGLYVEVSVVVVVEADGLRELALKQVRVTPRPEDLPPDFPPALADAYVRNDNPVLGAIRAAPSEEACPGAAPVPPGAFPAGRIVLCAPGVSAAQEYATCGPAGERTPALESGSWQWYATGGEFPDANAVGNETDAAPEFERPAGAFTLWSILRDGRGGVDWVRLDVDASSP